MLDAPYEERYHDCCITECSSLKKVLMMRLIIPEGQG